MGGGANEHVDEPVGEAVDWEVSGVINSGVHVNDVGLFIRLVTSQDGCTSIVQIFDPLGFDAVALANGYGSGDVPFDGFVSLGWLVVLLPSQVFEPLLQKVSFLFPFFALVLVQLFSMLDGGDETRDHGSYGCVDNGGWCQGGQ